KNDDIDLIAQEGQLRLKCERKAPEEERQYRFNNRQYGEFERVIALPEAVDPEKVTAEMREGILYLTLAKLPEAQPKRIAVQTG
ncbi:MAG TPA: Hsp20/alpha crystallin family protein, partial [Pirellulales bacterium]|nr:Hsp20/alpha crystallin family protein [Pirellulales bacterium]